MEKVTKRHLHLLVKRVEIENLCKMPLNRDIVAKLLGLRKTWFKSQHLIKDK